MGTKNNPGKFDCYNNALPDEPMFILLARDPNAPELVKNWASNRMYEIGFGKRPQTDIDMVKEAEDCAKEMEKWRKNNLNIWKK